MLAGAAILAISAVAMMGFAVQRGATCTVAAVGDVIEHGRWDRFVALAEASLWVAAMILAARAGGITMALPPVFAPTLTTIAGGVLLGLGAVVTGACVFGAIARLGSGDYAFAATPLGFYLGCLAFQHLAPAMPSAAPLPPFDLPVWLISIVATLAAWRLFRFATRPPAPRHPRWHRRVAHAWTPHAATLTIGVCFVVTLLAAGPWAYTDALAELARGMTAGTLFKLALFAALLAGAIAGGASAGLLGHRPIRARTLARCLAGGALMGIGSLLIPGSNDGLILIGLPLLAPYAWLAFATMVVTVAVGLRLIPSIP